MAENMVSGSAHRPGDVLTMYGGNTVEVLNTDAEGRLILATRWCATEAEPDLIVDVATLTGARASRSATGSAGVFGNDEAVDGACPAAAERAGEALWPLPIPEEMPEKVHLSKIADLLQHNSTCGRRRCTPRPSCASSSATAAVGAPRHRRPGVQRPAALRPRAPAGATGTARATLVAKRRGHGDWPPPTSEPACSFLRRLYSRIRAG